MMPSESKEGNRPNPLVSLLLLGTVAAVPYLLVRQRLTSLHTSLRATNLQLSTSHREMAKLRGTLGAIQEEIATQGMASAALREDVKMLSAELSKGRAELEGLREGQGEVRDVVYDVVEEAEQLREEKEEVAEKIYEVMEDVRQAVTRLQEADEQREQTRTEQEAMRFQELSAFLREHQDERSRIYASSLKDVGRSLADVAAFMYEVEVRQGYVPRPDDRRGIERARQLAKRLQELPGTFASCTTSQMSQFAETTQADSESPPPKSDEPSDMLSH
ncbi:hypothetical protein DAEQUDRAFT_813877 [Daedalea quercina L-15889]|uniref:Uncharacterized protein n=1 Tax=Daedalea quercina L-15889 TaxID=1314783 RepID=A0A165MRJ2_9APHY|nr:hypothetical protein DAEQUDRAFT_813877 [Daedalea quercina L-15889]